VTFKYLANSLDELDNRLYDELSLAKVFVLTPERHKYFGTDGPMFGLDVFNKFSSAAFEIDEAGKCNALARPTASIFHLMRTMEIAIRAVARSLGVPDPVKDAERNWGRILDKIKKEIDRRNSEKPAQWSSNDRNFFAEVYVSLDAVRIAWRNPTMHVENKYTDDEAEQILGAVRGFMKKLASRMDEDGIPTA
jgi:hypothetical protein